MCSVYPPRRELLCDAASAHGFSVRRLPVSGVDVRGVPVLTRGFSPSYDSRRRRPLGHQ
jgi:hypothetical protein